MKFFAAFTMLFLLSPAVQADDIFVIDSRRNIPLSDDEPVYKDFYLNAGEGSGLKKNLVVNVVRRIPIKDSAGAHSYGEIDVPVAQLRVIAVYGKVAVAREHKLLPREELPMLEQIGVMSGDRVDLAGSFTKAVKQ